MTDVVQLRDDTKTPASLRSGRWKTSSESVVNFVGIRSQKALEALGCASKHSYSLRRPQTLNQPSLTSAWIFKSRGTNDRQGRRTVVSLILLAGRVGGEWTSARRRTHGHNKIERSWRAPADSLVLDQLDISVIAADSLYLDRAVDQDRLAATIRRHRPTLLILDPLVRLHTADENVAGQMAALLGYFRALQRKTGVAILIIHHSRKNASPAAGAGYSLRGSSDLYAWVDSFLYVQRRRGRLTLSSEHRSAPGLGPLAFELVDSPHGPYLELTDPATADPSPAIDPVCHQILEVLSSSAQPVTADRLRSILQVRNQRVVETLRTLCGNGKIVRLAQGYALCSNPPLPLQ